jgi:polyhydroxyalkanoate synthesis repressor PhaR
MSEPRVIKRYANRKLYDTQHSCYVTLEQIAEMIREGEDVRIVDNNTKEDLTSVTLAQIIFEEEKKRRLLPLVGLKAIIQTSGESIQDFVNQVRGEVDSRVGKVFRRPEGEEGAEGVEEGAPGATAEEFLQTETAGEGADTAEVPGAAESAKTAAAFREFLKKSERRLDEWQNQVDQQVRKVVDNVHPIPRLQKDLQTALERIGELEKRIEGLVKKGKDKEKDK